METIQIIVVSRYTYKRFLQTRYSFLELSKFTVDEVINFVSQDRLYEVPLSRSDTVWVVDSGGSKKACIK